MKKRTRWGPPGWPWELELLALVFVVTAIVVPYYLQAQTTESPQLSILAQAEQAQASQRGSWQDLQEFIWAVIIVGLYLAHLVVASSSIDYMSTPFTHLFSPLLFSMITYYRLYTLVKDSPTATAIVSGSPLEIALWVLGVLVITFMVARIRMARYMLNFKHVDWDLTTPTLFDRSFWELAVYLRPLIYPPRLYRACPNGILIEGWVYAMPIPFETIHSVDAVQGAGFLSSGYCLATSAKSLVRLQISEKAEPLLISPKDRAEFVRYCEQRLSTTRLIKIPSETRHGAAGTTTRG
ncbi:MAG TPA: hypothetical protein P5567_00715 [Kiritimatiellia bacterium]|nr:hypothetical protein [Kiritimatiellia bacterium]HRZ10956.1 hypothetical protein [Kiritimatiellia bacterium]HSA18529.1 hypothetical protein [Kiritimatiellia bacterium]